MTRRHAGKPRCRTCVAFCRNCGFVHNSITEFSAPDLSYPQAQCWKSAKTKPPAHHLTATVKPARLQHGRRGRATPRKRWNDAVTTALAHGSEGKNEPPPHMAAIHRFPSPNGLLGVTQGSPIAVSHKGFSWGGARRAMADRRQRPAGRRIHAMAAASHVRIE